MIMPILNELMKIGAKVWTIKDNYRLRGKIQSKVLAFAFWLSAEIERDLISQRTKEALALRCGATDCWYQAIEQAGVCENKTGEDCPLAYPIVADCVEQMSTTKVGSTKQGAVPRVNELQRPGQTTVAARRRHSGRFL
jgi:hypothetical protein